MIPRTFLRTLAASLALTALALPALHAAPDVAGFPAKPVRIVVPVAAGGSADKLTRLIADKLTVLWGQYVVVENVAGASGTIGAARVAKAAPDGYTLLQQGEGLTLNSILFHELPYSAQSFTPIIKAVVNPQILAAVGIESRQRRAPSTNSCPSASAWAGSCCHARGRRQAGPEASNLG